MTVGVILGALCMTASIGEWLQWPRLLEVNVSNRLFLTLPFNGAAIHTWLLQCCSRCSMKSSAILADCKHIDHWVSEFAPKSVEKPLSYIVGWLALLGWVTGCPSAVQLTSTLVQGLILLKDENANVGQLWQTTLFIMVFLIVAVAFNLFLAKRLPLAEGIFLVVHIVGYFAFLIVLWTMSDHAPASQVFGTFNDGGGWGNTGLSCLVGITTPLWCFLGPDAGAHMSEALKDAGRVLPSAMVWATFFNGLLGLTMIITLCFCIGDVDGVLNSPTGIPVMQVLYNFTGSFTTTVIMSTVLIILSMVGTVTVIAATSRQMWAFARDKGLPFSSYVEYVSLPIPLLISSANNKHSRSAQAWTSPSTPSSAPSSSPS